MARGASTTNARNNPKQRALSCPQAAWTRHKSARRGPRPPKPTRPQRRLTRGLPPAYPQGTCALCACTHAGRRRAPARTCMRSARRATSSGAVGAPAECARSPHRLTLTKRAIPHLLGLVGGIRSQRCHGQQTLKHWHPCFPVTNPTPALASPNPFPPLRGFAGRRKKRDRRRRSPRSPPTQPLPLSHYKDH